MSSGCDAILANGVFNEIIVETNKSVRDNLYEWLKRADYVDVQRKINTGLQIGLPIQGIPINIGASFSKSQFDNWKSLIEQGRTRNFTSEEEQSIIMRSASRDICEAWLRCMGQSGLSSWLEDKGTYLLYSTKYLPTNQDDEPPEVLNFQVAGALAYNPIVAGAKIGYQGNSVILSRNGNDAVVVVLNTNKGTTSATLEAIPKIPTLPSLNVRLFEGRGEVAQSPDFQLVLDPGWKIISGGARVIWEPYGNYGNLLFASYPASQNSWIARAKSHTVVSPGHVEIAVMAIYDPNEEWEVEVASMTSESDIVSASLPPGYVLTGGGGQAMFYGYGRLLTASYPQASQTWEVRAKAHTQHDVGATVAHAIGIRPRNGAELPNADIFSQASEYSGAPEARCGVPSGYTCVGGGALVDWMGYGNLLTASYPDGSGWHAKSKAHTGECAARIIAYAIGLRV